VLYAVLIGSQWCAMGDNAPPPLEQLLRAVTQLSQTVASNAQAVARLVYPLARARAPAAAIFLTPSFPHRLPFSLTDSLSSSLPLFSAPAAAIFLTRSLPLPLFSASLFSGSFSHAVW